MNEHDTKPVARQHPRMAPGLGIPLWEHLDEAETADLTLASRRALSGHDGSRVGEIASEILGNAAIPPEQIQRTLTTFADTIYLANRQKRPRRRGPVFAKTSEVFDANTSNPHVNGIEGPTWRTRHRTVEVDDTIKPRIQKTKSREIQKDFVPSAIPTVSAADARLSREHRIGILRKRRQYQGIRRAKIDRVSQPQSSNGAAYGAFSVASFDQHHSEKSSSGPRHAESKLASCLRTLRHPDSESESSQDMPPGWTTSFDGSTCPDFTGHSSACSDSSGSSWCYGSALSAEFELERTSVAHEPEGCSGDADDIHQLKTPDVVLSHNELHAQSYSIIERDLLISPVSGDGRESGEQNLSKQRRRTNLMPALAAASERTGTKRHHFRETRTSNIPSAPSLFNSMVRPPPSERMISARARLKARLKKSSAFRTQR